MMGLAGLRMPCALGVMRRSLDGGRATRSRLQVKYGPTPHRRVMKLRLVILTTDREADGTETADELKETYEEFLNDQGLDIDFAVESVQIVDASSEKVDEEELG